MAGAFSTYPQLVSPLPMAGTSTTRRFSVRASANFPGSSSSSSSSSSTSVNAVGTEETSPGLSPPPGFKPPQPKRFAVRPDKFLDILGASLALPFRLGTGVFVSGYSASVVSESDIPPGQYALAIAGFKVKETSKLGPRPEKPIEIYEFESCPFCRKVREIVSILDLDVLYYPCPRNGPNFRPKVLQMGGKQQFPYMVDPNTGVSMYESDEIIKYLVQKYGNGTVPLMLSLGVITTLTEGFAMIGRMGKGSFYTPAADGDEVLGRGLEASEEPGGEHQSRSGEEGAVDPLPFSVLSDELFQDSPSHGSGIPKETPVFVPPLLALPAPVVSADLSLAMEQVQEAYKGDESATVDSGNLTKGEVMDILNKVENFMESQASETARLIGVSDAGVDKGLKSSLLLIKRRWMVDIARKAKSDAVGKIIDLKESDV